MAQQDLGGANSKNIKVKRKDLRKQLQRAKNAKNDDYYTLLSDIEKELKHYKNHFKGKVVFCNCDDPRVSNFFHYFSYNFKQLGLKKLITTCYKNQNKELFSKEKSEKAIYLEYTGSKNQNRIPNTTEIKIKHLNGDGDFRSQECIELLKQSDIVLTNPPFSLFREYAEQLIKYNKKFVIIGNKNAITYKEIFRLIKENKLWVGAMPMGHDMLFTVPDEYAKRMVETGKAGSQYRIIDGVLYGRSPSIWFTNLDIEKRHEDLILYKTYSGNEKEYPKYDQYDAINIDKVTEIPQDYNGAMGVPVTFLDKYNPDQFEILGLDDHRLTYPAWRGRGPSLKGKTIYRRIIIKNKKI